MATAQEYLQRDALSLEKKVEKLTISLAKVTTEVEQALQKRDVEVGKLEKILAPLRAQIPVLEAKVKALTAEIESRGLELTQLVDTHKVVHEDNGQKLSHAKNELAATRVDADLLDEAVEKLRKEKTDLKKDILELSQKKTKALKELAEALEGARKAIQNLENLKAKLLSLGKEKKKLEADIKRLTEKKNVLVEDVLTDRNKKLLEHHTRRTGLSQELDTKIREKQKVLRKPQS